MVWASEGYCESKNSDQAITEAYFLKRNNSGTENFDATDRNKKQKSTITFRSSNNPPFFVKGPDVNVIEDSGDIIIAHWAKDINAGGPGEEGQILTFKLEIDNTSLFEKIPTISEDGTLTLTPKAERFGETSIELYLQDDGPGTNTSEVQNFNIVIYPVNDRPTFTCGFDIILFEDRGEQVIPNWATNIKAGSWSEENQSLSFEVSFVDDSSFFAVAPIISKWGELTFTPALNRNGNVNIGIRLKDNGGTENGGEDTSLLQDFNITILSINDAPSFLLKNSQHTILEDQERQLISNWAFNISPGPLDESMQNITFRISNNNENLFSEQPAISIDGILSYTPKPDNFGEAKVFVFIEDDGGIANGGRNVSDPQEFYISVISVNDSPEFLLQKNEHRSNEDAIAQQVTNWAYDVKAGPSNENSQDLTFKVTTTRPEMFQVQPEISRAGVLTYHSAPNANGEANITVQLQDDGGTANGGKDTTIDKQFKIIIQATNDPPVNTSLPFISGTPEAAETLTAHIGEWNDNTDTTPGNLCYHFQWQTADNPLGTNLTILSSTNPTLTVLPNYQPFIRLKITVVDDGEGTPLCLSTHAFSDWIIVNNSDSNKKVNVDTIFPTHAYTTGGGVLHITGTNFQEGVTISIGNSKNLLTTYESSSHIYCDIPPHEAGYATIIVANPDGNSITLTETFLYETYPNQPPVINGSSYSAMMDEDWSYNTDLNDYVKDDDHPKNMLTWTFTFNTNIQITIDNNNKATFTTKEKNWFGEETITFIVYDPEGLSATMDFTIYVSPVNDPPRITDIPDQTIGENHFFSDIYLDNFVTDVDDPDNRIIWTTSGSNELSVKIVDHIAKVTVPYANWLGSETLTFKAEDQNGLYATDTAVFTVTKVNNLIPPDDLSASQTSNGIQLKWTPLLDDYNTTYAVYRSQLEDGIFYPIHSKPVTTYDVIKNGFIDTSIGPNVDYYYKVKSCKDNIESQFFSNTVKEKRIDHADFNIQFINRSHQILPTGGRVKYHMLLNKLPSFDGYMDIWCAEVPQDVLQYKLIVNGNETGKKAEGIQLLPATLDIELTSKSSLLVGEYHFKLQCLNMDGDLGNIQKTWDLDLTVVSHSGIFVDLTKDIIHKGRPCVIYGAIFPPLKSQPVLLTAFVNQQTYLSKQVYTDAGGTFTSSQWLESFEPGHYSIQASWNDTNSNKQTSSSHELIVEKKLTTITCLPGQDSKPSIHQDFSIKGQLSDLLEPARIHLKLFSPDGLHDQEYTIYTDANGQFFKSEPFFKENGLWTFKAYFMGNDIAIGCESDAYDIMVGNKGCAIIVGGGQASIQNTYWTVTKKLITEAYKDFKFMGFSDDAIHLMIDSQMIDIDNDDNPDNVVDTRPPTTDELIHIIENKYPHILNANDTLYIFMQGHGTDRSFFKLLGTDEYIASAQLNEALTNFQNKSNAQVVLILECCYSGLFIQELSHPRRIIITSSGNVPYNTDASGQISLSRYVFSRLRQGDSIQKAFGYAYRQLTIKGFPPPLLDDNGDGLVNETDGLLAGLSFLPGNLRWGQPEIVTVDYNSILDKQTSLPITVTLDTSPENIQRVWAQVIPPDAPILSGIQMIHFEETELPYDKENKYTGSIDGFSYDGTYTVLIYAENIENEITDPEQLIIRVTNVGHKKDYNGDGQITLMDIVYVLQSLSGLNNDQNIRIMDAVYLMQVLGNTGVN